MTPIEVTNSESVRSYLDQYTVPPTSSDMSMYRTEERLPVRNRTLWNHIGTNRKSNTMEDFSDILNDSLMIDENVEGDFTQSIREEFNKCIQQKHHVNNNNNINNSKISNNKILNNEKNMTVSSNLTETVETCFTNFLSNSHSNNISITSEYLNESMRTQNDSLHPNDMYRCQKNVSSCINQPFNPPLLSCEFLDVTVSSMDDHFLLDQWMSTTDDSLGYSLSASTTGIQSMPSTLLDNDNFQRYIPVKDMNSSIHKNTQKKFSSEENIRTHTPIKHVFNSLRGSNRDASLRTDHPPRPLFDGIDSPCRAAGAYIPPGSEELQEAVARARAKVQAVTGSISVWGESVQNNEEFSQTQSTSLTSSTPRTITNTHSNLYQKENYQEVLSNNRYSDQRQQQSPSRLPSASSTSPHIFIPKRSTRQHHKNQHQDTAKNTQTTVPLPSPMPSLSTTIQSSTSTTNRLELHRPLDQLIGQLPGTFSYYNILHILCK